MKFSIRLLYLYLFSFIGLLVSVIGGVRLAQLAIKVYIFGGADRYNAYVAPMRIPEEKGAAFSEIDIEEQKKINESESKRQRQREVSDATAMILIGAPLYLYHWKMIQKEGKKSK